MRVAATYSAHLVVKYDHSSDVPADDIVGLVTFSTLAAAGAIVCVTVCALSNAATITASALSVVYVQPGIGHVATGMMNGWDCC